MIGALRSSTRSRHRQRGFGDPRPSASRSCASQPAQNSSRVGSVLTMVEPGDIGESDGRWSAVRWPVDG